MSWTLTYNSDLNANLTGGERRGGAYLQRVGLIADADLEQIAGWRGAKLHASIHAINGRGLSAHAVGNLLTVSGIEAEPAFRLFNLWIEQPLGPGASMRVGQFTAGQEFMVSNTAALFVNSTFGWPGNFATDLPSGGPAYPLAAPGIRIAAERGDRTTVRSAVFAGDPAGPGTGDPQRRDLHGFNAMRLTGPPFVIAEVAHDFGSGSPSLTLTAGGWIHFGHFDDSAGRGHHDRDYAAYGILDARIWSKGGRSLHGFIRASASPSDRNPIDLYADAGFALSGLLRERPDDTLGLAIGIARISPPLRSSPRRREDLSNDAGRPPRSEAAVEVSYRFMVDKTAYLQPNAQWILHPAASALTREPNSSPPPDSAFVIGLRTSLTL